MKSFKPVSAFINNQSLILDLQCKTLFLNYLKIVISSTLDEYLFNFVDDFIFQFKFEQDGTVFIYNLKIKITPTEENLFKFSDSFEEDLKVYKQTKEFYLFKRVNQEITLPNIMCNDIFNNTISTTTFTVGHHLTKKPTFSILNEALPNYFNRQVIEITKDIFNWFKFLTEKLN